MLTFSLLQISQLGSPNAEPAVKLHRENGETTSSHGSHLWLIRVDSLLVLPACSGE